MENKTERFIVYATESWNYDTAQFESKDLFDFAREMDSWFWWNMEKIILIVDKDYIDPYFWNELEKAFWNTIETQKLLRKIIASVFNLSSLQ